MHAKKIYCPLLIMSTNVKMCDESMDNFNLNICIASFYAKKS